MIQLSKVVAVLTVILVMAGAAHAADPKADAPASVWSGAYIGAFAGSTWVNLKYFEPDWPGYERNPVINGIVWGPIMGYSFAIDRIVLGIEGDASWGKLSRDHDRTQKNQYSAFDINWNAHLRLKAGYALGPTLLFAAGGLATANVTDTDTDAGWSNDSATHVGWTAGGGIEYAITKSFHARAEYLYEDFGSKDYLITGPFPYRTTISLTANTCRLGLFYWF